MSDRAYPSNSRFNICSNGTQYLVEDKLTGKTLSWHNNYRAALRARDKASADYGKGKEPVAKGGR
jgi:hypothetical protein